MYEILINKEKDKKIVLILEDGKIVEKYEENDNVRKIEGNIYLGKVQNVLPGMQAAFVDIGEGKNSFIHLKDILPKIDQKTEEPQDTKKVNIKKIIKQGMPILVQIKRDSTNKKGARVSTHISLPGSFIVFMPETNFITISQKIEDKSEKERLINIVSKNLPKNCGAIIRTSAMNKEEKIIINDINLQVSKWEKIKEAKQNEDETNIPKLIYKNDGLIKKIFIDMIDKKIDKITVNTKEVYDKIKKITSEVGIDSKVEINLSKENLLERLTIKPQLEKIYDRKIWLKCGGFITIDKTEALTAIDVNSGKYIGSENLEKTVYTVNKEATVEIAKQLRLKDIGGIVIIDYIDMHEKESKQKIENILKEELKKDRSKTQVIGFTKLNLLEMTRKHIYSDE